MTAVPLGEPKSIDKEKRPRVRLEELPRGRGQAVFLVCLLVFALGVFALIAGGLKATGNLDKPDSEAVWLAHQKDILDQDYDEYLDEQAHQDAVSGTLMMALFFPALCGLGVLLWWSTVTESIKCPKGHVTYKVYSFCPECGEQVYSKDELSPDEWRKRYEPPVLPEGHA